MTLQDTVNAIASKILAGKWTDHDISELVIGYAYGLKNGGPMSDPIGGSLIQEIEKLKAAIQVFEKLKAERDQLKAEVSRLIGCWTEVDRLKALAGKLAKEAYAKGFADCRERAAKAMEFQVGNSLETSFDRALVEGGISVIRALKVPGQGLARPERPEAENDVKPGGK